MQAFSLQLTADSQAHNLRVIRMYWQGGLCLTGKAKSASILKGAALETGDFEGILKDIYHHLQMIVSFCLADYSAAEEMAERFWSENELEVGTVVGIPLHQMIRGLIAMRTAGINYWR
jgi:hypothetical protein